MTVIAIKDGIIAADSRVTLTTEDGGVRMFRCYKLFRKGKALIGLAGESSPGMVFYDWYGSDKRPPGKLIEGDADFTALVFRKEGIFEYDAYCRHEQIIEPFYAIGCGAKAALGAMHQGASAGEACAIACKIDPLCGLPIVSARLDIENPQDGPILPLLD